MKLTIIESPVEGLAKRSQTMSLQATFTTIREQENATAEDKLLKMITLMKGEQDITFNQAFARVTSMEPELHMEYLNSKGDK